MTLALIVVAALVALFFGIFRITRGKENYEMQKIYIYGKRVSSKDLIFRAIAEDGTCLASHLQTTVKLGKYEMGISSQYKHEFYEGHYPDGYELEFVDNPINHDGLQNALNKNPNFLGGTE